MNYAASSAPPTFVKQTDCDLSTFWNASLVLLVPYQVLPNPITSCTHTGLSALHTHTSQCTAHTHTGLSALHTHTRLSALHTHRSQCTAHTHRSQCTAHTTPIIGLQEVYVPIILYLYITNICLDDCMCTCTCVWVPL